MFPQIQCYPLRMSSTSTTTYTTFTRETILEDGNVIGEQEIEVEAIYSSGCDATYMEPEVYADVEIISATIDGEEVELTSQEEAAIVERILNNPPERDFYED